MTYKNTLIPHALLDIQQTSQLEFSIGGKMDLKLFILKLL
jgi:hypothetical protein